MINACLSPFNMRHERWEMRPMMKEEEDPETYHNKTMIKGESKQKRPTIKGWKHRR
jgi:hypothetical protein